MAVKRVGYLREEVLRPIVEEYAATNIAAFARMTAMKVS
jgi:hypothetical protein